MLALCLCFLQTNSLPAQFNWNNTTNVNASFNTPANWVGGVAPGSTNVARFGLPNTYEVWWDANTPVQIPSVSALRQPAGNVTYRNLDASPQHTLTINGAGGGGAYDDLSVSNAGTIMTLGGLNFRSLGGAEIFNGGRLNLVGQPTYPAGTRVSVEGTRGMQVNGILNMNLNAVLSVNDLAAIGRTAGTTGSATLNMSSVWNNAAELRVGAAGSGTLTILNSSQVTSALGAVARGAGSTGDVDIALNGRWTNTGDLSIGGTMTTLGGTGTVDLDFGNLSVGGTTKLWNGSRLSLNGGTVTTGSFDISAGGNFFFNDGTLTVNGAGGTFNPGSANFTLDGNPFQNPNAEAILELANTATATFTDTLTVGNASKGQLKINSGGAVTSFSGRVGDSAVGVGAVTLSGMGSSWNVTSDLIVGWVGTGSVTIESGSVLNTPRINIGIFSGSNNIVTVTGNGSLLNASSNAGIAIATQPGSTGSLQVLAGGRADSGNLFIGTGGSGSAIVNGAGSQVNVAGLLSIGNSASSTLNIEAGGVVTSVTGQLTRFYNGPATVTVTGAGSQWLNSGNLTVGNNVSAIGTINIQTGGLVRVGGMSVIMPQSIVNLTGGRFEFGTISQADYARINATSGSLAGKVNVSGVNPVASLSFLNTNNPNLNITEVQAANAGLLFGGAIVQGGLINQSTGELRTLSGEWVRFGGSSGNENYGRITLAGGSVEFVSSLTNQTGGLITGRGILTTGGGLTNSGTIALSGGTTDIYGDASNLTGGTIITSGGGTTTFFDDVVHNGTEIRTSANCHTVFFGSVSGAGAFTGPGTVYFEGDIRPGNSPAAVSYEGDLVLGGNAALTLELGGLLPGAEYDQMAIGGLLYADGILNIELYDGFSPKNGDRFDLFDATFQGNFDAVNLPTLGNALSWDTTALYSEGTLAITAIPEPGVWLAAGLLFAGSGITLFRKKLGKTSLTTSDLA
ncbi:MAG: hypothetical protein SFX18_13000 [Pirellulales bacterium]|nr:hypothetical protein [Pirellulales bacterium]